MGRAADWKKLGEALNDAKHKRLKNRHVVMTVVM
jgi:hypothetical protein